MEVGSPQLHPRSSSSMAGPSPVKRQRTKSASTGETSSNNAKALKAAGELLTTEVMRSFYIPLLLNVISTSLEF